MLPADVQVASREAARVLIDNHKAVVSFSSRALTLAKGRSGQTVSAPLAGYMRHILCGENSVVHNEAVFG